MPVNVYLNFNGNTEEVLHHYAEAFQTKVGEIARFSSMPGYESYIPKGYEDKIMHANLQIADSTVMFSDTLPEHEFIVGNNITVAVVTSDSNLLQHAFNILGNKGKIIMELQATPWSPLYGQVQDQYGVIW